MAVGAPVGVVPRSCTPEPKPVYALVYVISVILSTGT